MLLLLDQFNKEYEKLYENGDDYKREEVEAFDNFENKDFVIEFVKYRGDFILSDREAVAFVRAVKKVAPTIAHQLNDLSPLEHFKMVELGTEQFIAYDGDDGHALWTIEEALYNLENMKEGL